MSNSYIRVPLGEGRPEPVVEGVGSALHALLHAWAEQLDRISGSSQDVTLFRFIYKDGEGLYSLCGRDWEHKLDLLPQEVFRINQKFGDVQDVFMLVDGKKHCLMREGLFTDLYHEMLKAKT
jgi:hypothetical protein